MNIVTMMDRGRGGVIGCALLLALAMPAVAAQSRRVITIGGSDGDGAFLGIQMEDVTADNMATYRLSSERGVIVRSVEKGSPAEAASLQAKDVILEYAGTPVFSSMQLARLVRETPVGRRVDLVVSRDGKRLTLTVKVGKMEGPGNLPQRGFEIVPRDDLGREFEFRGPGGRYYNFRIPEGRGFNFAFPEGPLGRVDERSRLGVTLEPLTDQMAEFLAVPGRKGALVASVLEGSPAASKLKAGDVIIRADTSAIADPQDLLDIVRSKAAGARIELKVIRDKKEISVVVDVGKQDSKSGGFRL